MNEEENNNNNPYNDTTNDDINENKKNETLIDSNEDNPAENDDITASNTSDEAVDNSNTLIGNSNTNNETGDILDEELDEQDEHDDQFEYTNEQTDDEASTPPVQTDETHHKQTTKLKKEMLLGASVLVIVFIIVLAVVLFFSRGGTNYNKTITKTQVGKITQDELYQYYRINNESSIIVDLIINQVLLDNFAPTSEELEKEFQSKKSPYKNNSDFKDYIISSGFLSEEAYKQNLAMGLARDNFTSSIKVTDAEIEEYYNNELTDTRYASHILLDNEATALEVKEKLNAGEDFDSLVQQYSVDDSSKENNGDIGDISKLQLPEKLLNVANSLNENEISEPVNTEFGFHIIKITKVEPKKPLEELKEEILPSLEQQKSTSALVELLKKAQPITYEDKFFDQQIEEILAQFE